MEHLFPIQFSYLIPLLPLLGAAIAGFFGARWLKTQSHWPIWLGVGASAGLSVWLLWSMLGMAHGGAHGESAATLSYAQDWYTWIASGNFKVSAGFFFDPLTAVMLCVVTGIGFLIAIFSKGYMAGENGYFRFFAYIGLFIFAMTMLVMGNNFIMLYLGWEGVGLCSYLLIGYYYEKPAAREAAKKAFLVNRIGDLGFALGIMLTFMAFGSVSFYGNGYGTGTGVLEMASGTGLTAFQHHAMQWIPFLLMIGAFGKSAQFPLYVWLPDAMEGPTPVSALIHAATMVTAGVYMISRCGALFFGNAAAMTTIAVIGAFTALFAATIALRQFDLKKVFAYSTISQLGYMFVGVAALAPVAGVFHLVTHAFFKALLFLSSGVVMHAMMGELDMRKMSGLKRVLPKTRIFMLVGCLALAGFPLFSGFFSKDEIVHAAWQRNGVLGAVMLFTAFLTAYYTFRLYFRVFEGPEIIPVGPIPAHGNHSDADVHAGESAIDTHTAASSGGVGHLMLDPAHDPDSHGHDSHGHDSHGHDSHGHGGHAHNPEPWVMMLPLFLLAVGAILVGYVNWPGHQLADFLGKSPSFVLSHEMAAEHLTGVSIEPEMFGAHEPEAPNAPLIPPVMLISAAIALAGIGLAYHFHLRNRAAGERLAAAGGWYTRLIEHKYYVDEIYQNGIVEPLRNLGKAFFAIDKFIIDGLVWVIGFIPQLAGFVLKLTTQRGYLQGYAVTMLFGVAVILLVVFKVF